MQRCSLSAQQRTIQSKKGTGAPPHFPELSLRGGAADVAISQCPLGYQGNHRRYRSRLSEIAAAPPGPRNANSGKCRGTSAPLHSSITLYKAVTDRRYSQIWQRVRSAMVCTSGKCLPEIAPQGHFLALRAQGATGAKRPRNDKFGSLTHSALNSPHFTLLFPHLPKGSHHV